MKPDLYKWLFEKKFFIFDVSCAWNLEWRSNTSVYSVYIQVEMRHNFLSTLHLHVYIKSLVNVNNILYKVHTRCIQGTWTCIIQFWMMSTHSSNDKAHYQNSYPPHYLSMSFNFYSSYTANAQPYTQQTEQLNNRFSIAADAWLNVQEWKWCVVNLGHCDRELTPMEVMGSLLDHKEQIEAAK